MTPPRCPKCQSEFTYEDGDLLICPECAHEWSKTASTEAVDEAKVEGFGAMQLKSEFVKKS